MSAYVILIGSEEKGEMDFIGPFEESADAQMWLTGNALVEAWIETQRNLFGGWPGAYIVCDQTCYSPSEWVDAW